MIAIRIINYEKYKGRLDVKNNSWFRCSNRILEDHEFFEFSHEEMLVWIYFLSLASQKNTSDIVVSHQHAHQVARLSAQAVDSAIEKLRKIKCIEKIRTRTVRGRYVHDTHTCATEQTEQTEQTEHNTQEECSSDVEGHDPRLQSSLGFLFFLKIKGIKPQISSVWLEIYEVQWILDQLQQARVWCLANPKKAPKDPARFLTNWFSRGWETYRKTIPSNRPSSVSDYSFLKEKGA